MGAALNVASIHLGDSVMVIGCGAVGLSAVQGARMAGAATIVAVDLEDRKLELALTEQGVYKRSDLSLRTLAELLHERPHYVSQIISQEFSSSFYDLVNRYRIEHAKRLLVGGQSIKSIAYSMGFSSPSSFTFAFFFCESKM